MFIGTLSKGKSLAGYIEKGLVEPHTLIERHTELVVEMILRGYTHLTPLRPRKIPRGGKIDVAANIEELKRRCPDCRKRIGDRQLNDLLSLHT